MITHLITERSRDLGGGFKVGRVLPYAPQRMVGPFIFFDHMGPADFGPGQGVNARSHPHIGLATVTYLFEGAFMHRDSLGTAQLIRPGDVNWMVAGRGIVHSERTPPEVRDANGRTHAHGIQTWVALPRAEEEREPSFAHHGAASGHFAFRRVPQPWYVCPPDSTVTTWSYSMSPSSTQRSALIVALSETASFCTE